MKAAFWFRSLTHHDKKNFYFFTTNILSFRLHRVFLVFISLFIFYNIYKKGKLEYYYKYVTKRPSPQKIQEIQFCNDVVFACLKEFNEWRDLLFFFYDIINAKVRLGGPKCWKDTSLFFGPLFQCTVVKNA